MEKLGNQARKKTQILRCEWCGKPLHPESEEPVEHGKMKVCQACHIDLNWFKTELHDKPHCISRPRNRAIAHVND